MGNELNYFDPPDPGANEPPNQSVARERRLRLIRDQQTPQQRVSGGFGAVRVQDRSQPGYAGSFLDPQTQQQFLGQPGTSYPGAAETRPPLFEDQFNPLSQALGVRQVALPEEQAILAMDPTARPKKVSY